MPSVRIKPWKPDSTPASLPAFEKVFFAETGMDADQVAEAFGRLNAGRTFDVPFDTGDEHMARGMMKELAALGLQSELADDTARGRRAPFKRGRDIALGPRAILVLAAVAFRLLPVRGDLRIVAVLAIAVTALLLALSRSDRGFLPTVAARNERQLREADWVLWILAGLFVLGAILRLPWLGMLLLAVGLGGVGFAFLVRWRVRVADQQFEDLNHLGTNDKGGGPL